MFRPVFRGITEAFIEWCGDNSPAAKLERTIAQGVIGVSFGMLANLVDAPEWFTYAIIPIVMAIVAPIQAVIAESNKE